MKKRLLTFSALTLILSMGLVNAQVSQTTITYLTNSPQDAWVTQGLAATGQTNLNLGYLNNFSGNNANEVARTILAVVAAQEDPYDFNDQNLVVNLIGYHNNQQIGSTSLLNDDFWGLMALRAAGEEVNLPIITDAKNFILTAQNTDGGWGFSPTASSDTNDTAAAIMALLDAGLTASSPEIMEAVDYLELAQNNDGGFSFYPLGISDAGSDAWVIDALTKIGINPTTWQKNGYNPIGHLESLILPDGSFRWVATDLTGNLLMTAYAAVALSGKYYPVRYQTAPPVNPNLHHLRIEGASQTYCNTEVEAVNALEIIEHGALICNYTYQIESGSLGQYLVSINGETAAGESGWLYRVNWLSPVIGAGQYSLTVGDEVLWYFGEYTDLPLKITLSLNQAEINAPVTATVEYFNNGVWLPADAASVLVSGQTYLTNNAGQIVLTIGQNGVYQVYAEKENYVRSNHAELIIGDGAAQTVNLSVNIENNPGGGGGGSTPGISFNISSNNLSFGSLAPGETATSALAITNNGSLPIYLETTVAGDAIFENNLYLDEVFWESYQTMVGGVQTRNITTRLSVPANYLGSGQKQGTIIFWATNQP